MENYFTSIEPFYKITNVFGFLPMSFVKPVRNGNLKFTYFSVFRTSLVFVFLLILIFFIIRNHIIFSNENQSFLVVMIWSWFLLFIYPFIIVQLIFQLTKAKDIRDLFCFIDEIDSKFHKLFIKIDHQRYRKKIFRVTVFMIGTLILRFSGSFVVGLLNAEHYTSKGSMQVQEIAYLVFLLYVTLFTLQFVFLTYLLRERFVVLKELLR